MTGTAAVPAPTTALQLLKPLQWAWQLLQSLRIDAVVKPDNPPMPVSVAPIQKKKYTKKLVHPMRDDNEPRPSQEQEKEAEPEVRVPE